MANGWAGIQDWEAGLVAYVAALLIAQTEAAPVAVVGAWGIALFMLIDQVGSGGKTLPGFLSNIKNSITQPARTVPPNTNLQVNTTGAPGGLQGFQGLNPGYPPVPVPGSIAGG